MEPSAFYELEVLLSGHDDCLKSPKAVLSRIVLRHPEGNSLPVPNRGLLSQYLWVSTSGAPPRLTFAGTDPGT